MMAKGIVNIKTYIPKYRMPISEMNKAWEKNGGRGEVSVANHDEDSITMAVQSAIDYSFSKKINTCVLATTSSPFQEESAASIVAYTLGLNENVRAIDINQSVTSGLSSLSLFHEEQLHQSSALIIASDKRSPEMGSSAETQIGSGASVIELGKDQLIAEIIGSEKINDFGYDTWQRNLDETLSIADEKFSRNVRTQQYKKLVDQILTKTGIKNEQIDHLIVADVNSRLQQAIAQQMNRKDLVVGNQISENIGYTGTASPFIMLHDTLTKANPGDYVLTVQSGSGFEAVLFKVTDKIKQFQKEDKLNELLQQTEKMSNYQEFLRKKNINERADLQPYSSLTYIRRERNVNLRLLAQVCEQCKTIHFPQQIVCRECKRILGENYRRLKHTGTLFTFTKDYVFPGKDAYVTMAMIDLDEGGRLFTQMTDVNEKDLEIGLKVSLSFRKIHDGAGYPNYFWKAVPHNEVGSKQ